jgi:hypothetical protein
MGLWLFLFTLFTNEDKKQAKSMVPLHRPSTSQEPSSGPTNLPSASPSLKPTVTFLPSQAPSRFGICNSASRFDGWCPIRSALRQHQRQMEELSFLVTILSSLWIYPLRTLGFVEEA